MRTLGAPAVVDLIALAVSAAVVSHVGGCPRNMRVEVQLSAAAVVLPCHMTDSDHVRLTRRVELAHGRIVRDEAL